MSKDTDYFPLIESDLDVAYTQPGSSIISTKWCNTESSSWIPHGCANSCSILDLKTLKVYDMKKRLDPNIWGATWLFLCWVWRLHFYTLTCSWGKLWTPKRVCWSCKTNCNESIQWNNFPVSKILKWRVSVSIFLIFLFCKVAVGSLCCVSFYWPYSFLRVLQWRLSLYFISLLYHHCVGFPSLNEWQIKAWRRGRTETEREGDNSKREMRQFSENGSIKVCVWVGLWVGWALSSLPRNCSHLLVVVKSWKWWGLVLSLWWTFPELSVLKSLTDHIKDSFS